MRRGWSGSAGELRGCLRVAGAFVEDGPPELLGFVVVAAFLGKRGEVAQGEVAVDALIDAAKLGRTVL